MLRVLSYYGKKSRRSWLYSRSACDNIYKAVCLAVLPCVMMGPSENASPVLTEGLMLTKASEML